MDRKTIGICIPCYNEEENVTQIAEEIIDLFNTELSGYNYHIQFIDNHSTDTTQERIEKLCEKYKNIRAIFNAKNFPLTSGYYGLLEVGGDCSITIPCDFQIPLDTIPKMIHEWENGAKIVCLIRKMRIVSLDINLIRKLYYFLSNTFSERKELSGFTGAGLYDKKFLDICRSVKNPDASISGMIWLFGYDIVNIEYVESKRRYGKSKQNAWTLITIAIKRFVTRSAMAPQIAIVLGFVMAIVCLIVGLVYLILKLIYWDMFTAGQAPILIGVFLIGSIQLFFLGLFGQYILKMNKDVLQFPLVVEEKRINYPEELHDEH